MTAPDLALVTPRTCQREVLDLVFGHKAEENKWYVVSPPGSGKTVLGLMIALRMGIPTLVLVPNTAIQMQWVAKSKLFLPEGCGPVASIDPDDELPITVLTYQALARAERFSDAEREDLVRGWLAELTGEAEEDSGDIEETAGEVMDGPAARQWLADFEKQNGERFETALLRRWKRQRLSADNVSAETLVDDKARDLMRRLAEKGVRLVIFDECHHLVGYWAQVALALKGELKTPQVLGFTATPPSAKELSNTEIKLHKDLLDEIDYQLPTPAVVREGSLAPYQDLVYFTRPLERELAFVQGCSDRLKEVLASVEVGLGRHGGRPSKATVGCDGGPGSVPAAAAKCPEAPNGGATLSAWLTGRMNEVPEDRLASVLRRRERFFANSANYLRSTGNPVPERFRHLQEMPLELEECADLVGRFAVRCLLVSREKADRDRFESLARAFRPLGFQLTDAGLRRCQSTVGRVLALSEAKMRGLVELLSAELDAGGEKIKALVICDFEKSSATVAKDISHLLTAESGGAIAAMRALTSNEATDRLDPILVTGQTVLVDDDLLQKFLDSAKKWFEAKGMTAALTPEEEQGFYRIEGRGRDWNVRTYVAMITEFLERGITRCLVGTRGLLGEGWDALTVNTLVDLTIAATRMTVNQLRGRAIRLDPGDPRKVSNIWDVVCLAPEFEKGLSDYHRFARKHSHYYGVCDDGAIEYGLGHIHPALTEVGPEDVAMNAHVLNGEMIERCGGRAKIYEQWEVGTPYENKRVPTLEIHAEGMFGDLGTKGGKVYDIRAGEMLKNMCLAISEGIRAVGGFEDAQTRVEVSERADGYYRIRLDTTSQKDMELMAVSIRELFAPIADQRYIIPRTECTLAQNWFTKLLPAVVRRYVCKKKEHVAIYHPVPEVLGQSKRHAEAFTVRWNKYVSPGKAVYTKRGRGEEILMKMRPRSQSVMAARTKLKSVWM